VHRQLSRQFDPLRFIVFRETHVDGRVPETEVDAGPLPSEDSPLRIAVVGCEHQECFEFQIAFFLPHADHA
jgi:hypothetical protein